MTKKTKRTFLVSIRVISAKHEFAPGMGVGVIATQEVTFHIPEDYNPAMLESSVYQHGQQMLREEIAIDVKEIV